MLAAVAMGAVLFILNGCISAGLDVAGQVDQSLVTSATQGRVIGASGLPSDRARLRDAVATADLAAADTLPLPWADAATGTTGVISAIERTDRRGTPCRRFTTTLHNYEGIGLYGGETCRDAQGAWLLTTFERRG